MAKMYQAPNEKQLEQGDIFRFPLPLPFASVDQKIVRNLNGPDALKVYTPDVLDALENEARAFGEDGRTTEFVIVEAARTEWFILGTQSCDLFWQKDEKNPKKSRIPKSDCFVHRIETVHEMFTGLRSMFRIGSEDVEATPHELLIREAGEQCDRHGLDPALPLQYGTKLRAVIADWNPTKHLRPIKNAMADRIDNQIKRDYMFWLSENNEHEIPEAFVDLTSPYAVRWETLRELAIPANHLRPSARKATLTPRWKLIFAREAANRICRPSIEDEDQPPLLRASKGG